MPEPYNDKEFDMSTNGARNGIARLLDAVVEAWADCRHASRRVIELQTEFPEA